MVTLNDENQPKWVTIVDESMRKVSKVSFGSEMMVQEKTQPRQTVTTPKVDEMKFGVNWKTFLADFWAGIVKKSEKLIQPNQMNKIFCETLPKGQLIIKIIFMRLPCLKEKKFFVLFGPKKSHWIRALLELLYFCRLKCSSWWGGVFLAF